MLLAFLLIPWQQFAEAQHAERQPAALLAAERHRAFINARVEWTSRRLTEKSDSVIRGLAQYTKDEFLFVNDFGLIPTNTGPQPFIKKTLFYENQYWSNQNNSSLTVRVRDENKDRYFDIRALGMCASATFPGSVADALWRPFPVDRPCRYEVVRKEGCHVVTATMVGDVPGLNGTLAHRWWIDPARGWSAVRCQELLDGKVQREVVSNPHDYDGVWFPQSLAFFEIGFEEGRRPYATVSIESARFNDPQLADRLSPADIGVEVGTNVTYIDRNGVGTVNGWDGRKMTPFRSVAGMIRRGEIEIGAKVQSQIRDALATANARADAEGRRGGEPILELGLANVPTYVSQWERYVRRFIHMHGLDAGQIQSAWRIHDDCKGRAERYLAAQASDFEKLRQRQLGVDRIPDTEDKTAGLAGIAESRAALFRPVVEIFESSLKPRLEKLLTREQREEPPVTGTTSSSSPPEQSGPRRDHHFVGSGGESPMAEARTLRAPRHRRPSVVRHLRYPPSGQSSR